jgi:hypothetical protein
MPHLQRPPQLLAEQVSLTQHLHERMRHKLLPRAGRRHRPAELLPLRQDRRAPLHRIRVGRQCIAVQVDNTLLSHRSDPACKNLELETFAKRGAARLPRAHAHECYGPSLSNGEIVVAYCRVLETMLSLVPGMGCSLSI